MNQQNRALKINASLTDNQNSADDKLIFKQESTSDKHQPLCKTTNSSVWRILIADDEEDVHSITRFALADFTFDGLKIDLVSAYSAKEAISLLSENNGFSLILLDVVMKGADGLDLVNYIRNDLNDSSTRIVLRTGQPGLAPESEVVEKYDINDYLLKSEVTTTRLRSAITVGLRSYKNIMAVNSERKIAVEAMKSSQARFEFLAHMSHEIRTPMYGVIGSAELLLESELTQEQENNVNAINASGKVLLALINKILEFSKSKSGHLELEKIDFSLTELILDVEHIFKLKITAKDLAFKVSVQKGVPIFLKGDAVRIKQVLINFIGNAIKFTERGSINLKISYRDLKNQQVELIFEVIDSGIGIDKQKQKKLFQPFTQAEKSTSRVYGGTGLGLTISRQIARQMGGDISVSSVVDKGSVFRFELTIDVGSENAYQHLENEKHNEQSTKQITPADYCILVVEDNEINQMVTAKILTNLGYQIDVSGNGEEAINLIEKKHFDLILMDCNMPVMDGYTSTKLLRKQDKFKDLPIIAMTAGILPEDEQKCLECGMNDFVTKPTSQKVINKIIQKWLIRAVSKNTPN